MDCLLHGCLLVVGSAVIWVCGGYIGLCCYRLILTGGFVVAVLLWIGCLGW